MNSNTKKAKEILEQNGFTLVLYDGCELLTKQDRGVKPLLELLSENRDFSGFSAADKVVGSAAAYLYVLLKVREVYALTISERARLIFEEYSIPCEADCEAPFIINCKADGLCPMESAVADVVSPEDALEKIKEAVKALN